MDTLLLFLLITSAFCVLLILILCGVLIKILLAPGSIGETLDRRGDGSEGSGSGDNRGHRRRHRRPQSYTTLGEIDDMSTSSSPPALRHQHRRPPGGKFKRPSRGSLRRQEQQEYRQPPTTGGGQNTTEIVAPSPGKIVELGFGALKSTVKMHMSIGEPDKNDLTYLGSPAPPSPTSTAANNNANKR